MKRLFIIKIKERFVLTTDISLNKRHGLGMLAILLGQVSNQASQHQQASHATSQ